MRLSLSLSPSVSISPCFHHSIFSLYTCEFAIIAFNVIKKMAMRDIECCWRHAIIHVVVVVVAVVVVCSLFFFSSFLIPFYLTFMRSCCVVAAIQLFSLSLSFGNFLFIFILFLSVYTLVEAIDCTYYVWAMSYVPYSNPIFVYM